jgi:hypothetical protein
MRGSMFKYIDQRQDELGQALFWPGNQEGLPFRGERPQGLRDSEFEDLQIVGDFYHRTFYFDEPTDADEYRNVMDRICSGWYVQKDRIREWDTDRRCYRVYLEWVQLYSMLPQGGRKPLYQVGDTNGMESSLSLDQIG